jgi:hypothetical protein
MLLFYFFLRRIADLNQLGLGGQGQMLAANIVVNARLDTNFAKDGGARNREKRHYYYGADIPAHDEVGPPYMSLTPKNVIFDLSPRKRGRYARGQDEMDLDDEYEISPSRSEDRREGGRRRSNERPRAAGNGATYGGV